MVCFSSTVSLLANAYFLHHASAAAIDTRAANSPYAPIPVSCPRTPLVRSADGISQSESTYVTARKTKADKALAAWLSKTDPAFSTASLPTLALALSGGGLRAFLTGAGVVQAFDSRDTTSSTGGILQSLTYQSALSGGGWLSSSLAGNNWPTVSALKDSLWTQAFQDTLLLPENLLFAFAYGEIVDDIISKHKAGFDPTLIDTYGRLLGYQLLKGPKGGVATRLSDVASFSEFTSHNVAFPIITARGLLEHQCVPDANATQYEFSPYEFGSWDSGVKAFTQTAYLGSALTDGLPTVAGACISRYDNLGYIMGTTSDVFNRLCSIIPPINSTNNLDTTLEAIIDRVHDPVERDLFAPYPNPFYKSSGSSLVAAQQELHLVDGGEAAANIPLWPFIQEGRNVDVIIASDSSDEGADGFPNGTQILHPYQLAQAAGLTKMPFIPSVDTFLSEGLNKRATFFGCDEEKAVTIVYLPNHKYTFDSSTSTYKIQYTKEETDAMIANGNRIANQNEDKDWATCLGCAIMKKTGGVLPDACTACFKTYCYSA